jgi:hypothetical protein
MKKPLFALLVLLVMGTCFLLACDEAKEKESESVVTSYNVVCVPDTDLCWQDPQREADNYDDTGLRAFEVDQYCDELVLGGFDDWRIPTIMELRSITAGFENTTPEGSCDIVDGSLTYAEAQNPACFNISESLEKNVTFNGPGDNGCYLKDDFTGTCDNPDPYSGGHPLEHVALETPLDDPLWRAVLMFENGSVLFNHRCTGVDVRCVRDDDGSPISTCVENESCTAGETKACPCEGFSERPDGIQTCNDAGNCWGPCECTKSIVDTSVDEDCHRADSEFYDKADILTVNIDVPEGNTPDYDPEVLVALLYSCPDDTTPMPQRPPDGGSWENQIENPGQPPYTIEIRGVTYYREGFIPDGRYCLLMQLSKKSIMPPIPQVGDYFYWDASQGITFPLDGGKQTITANFPKAVGAP